MYKNTAQPYCLFSPLLSHCCRSGCPLFENSILNKIDEKNKPCLFSFTCGVVGVNELVRFHLTYLCLLCTEFGPHWVHPSIYLFILIALGCIMNTPTLTLL